LGLGTVVFVHPPLSVVERYGGDGDDDLEATDYDSSISQVADYLDGGTLSDSCTADSEDNLTSCESVYRY
jgi:hypothetical protein